MSWSDVRHHYEDPEPPEDNWRSLSATVHTARKPHGCQACEWEIAPGQRYKKLVALDDGKFTVLRTHEDRAECSAARRDRERAERLDREDRAAWMAEQWAEEARRCAVEDECRDRWDAHMDEMWSLIAEHHAYA